MGLAEEFQALTTAFSGLGVDEKSIIQIAEKWDTEQMSSYRNASPHFSQHHHFQAWHSHVVAFIHNEFARFKEAVVLWTMHPWERDARLVREALGAKTHGVLIEIACTRSSEELLGARRAYHTLFHNSIEEDITFDDSIPASYRNLLVPLVSSYRYEGHKLREDVAKSEAKNLGKVIKSADMKAIDNEEIVRVLATRSKAHLKEVFNHYTEVHGKTIDEDLKDEASLRDTILCLGSPQAYFSKVLNAGLVDGADERAKEALIRVIVTRADVDMKEIKDDYQKQYGVPLSNKIKEKTHGNFKDFLLTLVEKAK